MKYSAKIILLFFYLFACASLRAQPKNYTAKIKAYQKAYVKAHEVVATKDKKYFRFFTPNETYRIKAGFKKSADTTGFIMKTSGIDNKKYFRYGTINFRLNNVALQLTIYQSQQLMADTAFKSYLFLPFTDITSGEESYGGGRYIDLEMKDIKNNTLTIDFNKAYNPYCAYASGYNCPIPPAENDMPIAILAGEKEFGKKTH